MKLPLLVTLSLAANAALLATLYLRQPGKDPALGIALPDAGRPAAEASILVRPPGEPGFPAPESLRGLFDPSDLPATVSRLRAAGYPPEFIRQVALAMVHEEMSGRIRALGSQPVQPFWSVGGGRAGAANPAMSALNQEIFARVRALLGENAGAIDDAQHARVYGSIPREKSVEIQRLTEQFDEMRSAVPPPGQVTPAVRQGQMLEIERRQRAALAALLTPDELEQYELRNSATATTLRAQLDGFFPTESEFIALFQLQQEADLSLGAGGAPITPAQRAAAQQKLTEQVRETLSPERLAEYELIATGNYRLVDTLVTRLKLPPETTRKVLELEKDIRDRSNAVRAGRGATAAARNEELGALANEAAARLTETLGAEGLAVYRNNITGTWLNTLPSGNSATVIVR